MRVSVIPARSSSRYQSALERARRDTSNASTIPTSPNAICSVSSPNPGLTDEPDPLTPRSVSMTRTAARGQPHATALSASAYCLRVDS
jgi:hypothetical protein